MDPEERVRAAACAAVRDMSVEALVHLQPEVLQAVIGRCLDKKVRVMFRIRCSSRTVAAAALTWTERPVAGPAAAVRAQRGHPSGFAGVRQSDQQQVPRRDSELPSLFPRRNPNKPGSRCSSE